VVSAVGTSVAREAETDLRRLNGVPKGARDYNGKGQEVPMRLPRELDPVEIRVLGCLLEKERITPDAYPLSVNALVAACNQKSNRDPVMQLSPVDVDETLARLRNEVMVWPEDGARTRKWSHNLGRKWGLSPDAMAVMTVLLLRGPQTAAELRARTERMHAFTSTTQVEETLVSLSEGDEALAVHLGRRPGQKEARWTHLVGGKPEVAAASFSPSPSAPPARGIAERVTELEQRVARLEERLQQTDH
jgi:uncharacterized protein YceH (UPF0502 family)